MIRPIAKWSLPAGSRAGCAPVGKISAADVVARNAAARGGLEARRKVHTMAWNGHLEGAPVPGTPFELGQKRPDKTRRVDTATGARSVRVFDGSRGWRMRLTHGRPQVEPCLPARLRARRRPPTASTVR